MKFQQVNIKDYLFIIPWYLLIDENGNIIIKHASRPSQLKKLEKELDENLQ